jgi:hypothetical protein
MTIKTIRDVQLISAWKREYEATTTRDEVQELVHRTAQDLLFELYSAHQRVCNTTGLDARQMSVLSVIVTEMCRREDESVEETKKN